MKTLSRSAIFTALAVALLYVSAVMPSGRIGFAAVAGALSAAVVIHCGILPAWGVFIASALLSLLILPVKAGAILYTAFFGYYPVIKSLVERLSSRALGWILKFLVLNAAFALLWMLAGEVIALEAGIFEKAFPFALGAVNLVFWVYDLGLSGLITLYLQKMSGRIER